MNGHFDVGQPKSLTVTQVSIDLRGHISKTADSSAKLVVIVGNKQKVFEWPQDSKASEDFFASMGFECENGRLPNPFLISADAVAKRTGQANSALVTLDSIDISLKEK